MSDVRAGELAYVGTETIHRACAGQPTLLMRFRVKLAKAKLRIAEAERQLLEETRSAATARRRAMDLESDNQNLRTQAARLQAELAQAHARITQEQQRNRTDREERELAVRRQAELLTENDNLRNELRVLLTQEQLRARGGSTTQDATRAADPPAQDGKDDAQIRASLLELD